MRRGLPSLAALLLLPLCACDWDYYALLNSVPVDGDPQANEVVHVLVGIDGLAWQAASDAQSRGSFEGWQLARHLTPFPGTSDVCWSRILHSKPADSYEYQYFDSEKDELIRAGYRGLLMHAIPMTRKPCYRSFESLGNGLTGSYYNYRATGYSLGTSLDNFFVTLEGRAQSKSTEAFFGYFSELDALGHMATYEDYLAALELVGRRIEKFKARHPERTWLFTIVSDHGHNFVPSPGDKMVRFQNELPKVGIQSVDKLAGRDPNGPLVAVPIIHTRVTYLSLHTLPEQAPRIAERVSGLGFVDMAIARLPAPEELEGAEGLLWYGIWRDGAAALRFGFDPASDRYLLDRGGALEPLGLGALAGEGLAGFSDEELFGATAQGDYPDLLYRVRTALEPVGVVHPAQVLFSFRQPFASVGFEIPGGANEIASASFHGSMHRKDSLGVVMTEEPQALPPAIRADDLLGFFPELRRHLEERGLAVDRVDENEALDYPSIPFPP